MRYLTAALGCAAFLTASGAQAADDYFQIGAGIDYSRGDYGSAIDTEMLALPFSAKLVDGPLTLRASLPWLDVTGPADVVPGDGGTGGGRGNGGSAGIASRSGIGDLTVGGSYSLTLNSHTWLDFGAKAKLPTASRDKALGTGTTDITLETELLKSFGPWSASVGLGRRFNGSNREFPLRDVWQGGAGLYRTNGPTQFGLDYEWRQASLPGGGRRSELTGSVTHTMSAQTRLQGYVYTGLTMGSPDIGVGAQLLYRLGR